jgi:hypothetical protein
MPKKVSDEVRTERLATRVTAAFKDLVRRVGADLGTDEANTIQYCVTDVAKQRGVPLMAPPAAIHSTQSKKRRSTPSA